MPNKPFLFINKDSTSKSLSNNYDENQLGPNRIHKHVQRLSARQRREQAANIDTNARAVLGWYSTRQSRWVPELSRFVPDSTLEVDQDEDPGGDLKVEKVYSGPVDDKKVRVYRGKARCRIHKDQNFSEYHIDAAIHSLPDAVIKLTEKEHRILQYYLKEWMPFGHSDNHIPTDCQVAGFTPIWEDDPKNTGIVVTGALQTRSPVSIWSLLAAAARRMQKVDQVALPEFYSYQAISSLRARLSNPEDVDERLILDLSYLIHFDFHTDYRTRNDIYWKLSRDLIVKLGGLQKLQPFTARIAGAYDYVAALYSVTTPRLDPFRDPALLGLDAKSQTGDIKTEVERRLSLLEPRLRHEVRMQHFLADLFECIKNLPSPTFDSFKHNLIDRNGHTIYAIMAGPFQRISPKSVHSKKPEDRSSLTLADEIHAITRGLMSHAWMWYSALSFLGYHRKTITEDDPWAEARLFYRGPPHVIDPLIHNRWQSLDRVQALLDGSDWQVPHDRLLWFLAIGYVLARDNSEREPYKQRFVDQAQRMSIKTEQHLKTALESHMPLDLIAPAWSDMLMELLSLRSDEKLQSHRQQQQQPAESKSSGVPWTMLKRGRADDDIEAHSKVADRYAVLPTVLYPQVSRVMTKPEP